jgi:hypothetical protein
LASITLADLYVFIPEFRRMPSFAANASRGGETRLGALADQAALEFHERAEHVKNKPTLRGRRVEDFARCAAIVTDNGSFGLAS